MAKPAKPSPDFPLFPHGNGQWAKEIDGKLRYSGSCSDPGGALLRYRATQSDTEQSKLSPDPKSDKPPEPRKDFPLYPHASGKWAKRIRGKVHYFGSWDDPRAALEEHLRVKDDLPAGRTPSNGEGLTIRELVNRFLTSKRALVEGGEIQLRT